MSTSTGAKNLILGLSEGLTWTQLRPFVESLKRTSFAGDLHLFVGRTDAETIDVLRSEGVILHPYRHLRYERNGRIYDAYDPPLRRFRLSRITPLYPPLIRTLSNLSTDRLRTAARLAAPISIPHVARYFRFYRFLADTANHAYENVMLTDVYDVFFQRDPFDFDIGEDVHVFLEDERQTLGSERYHRDWLRIAYGEETLRQLGDKAISCSGITIARRGEMLAYLRFMTEELLKLPRQTVGIDQGVHNYVIHKHLLPRVRLVRNGAGAVLTVAQVPPDEIDRAIDDGRVDSNAVHQYQHHARLKEVLLNRLV
jgi:hypothetical protein